MGWDMIAPKLLKLAAKEIAPSLTNIFNLAIKWGNTKQLEKRRMDSCSKKDERKEKKKLDQ